MARLDREGRLSLLGPSLGEARWIAAGTAASFDEAGFLFLKF
jgi:hypothetical protein